MPVAIYKHHQTCSKLKERPLQGLRTNLNAVNESFYLLTYLLADLFNRL